MSAPMGVGSEPFATLRFRWPWRPYQERVLEALESHLQDRKLHVVASPGSGKTVLGLELFRRLGKPAVVFSPTTTIRNQWVSRLRDFLPSDAPHPPAWMSQDLREPGLFTSVTYQAMHTKYRDSIAQQTSENAAEQDSAAQEPTLDAPTASDLDRVIRELKKAAVGTLILDEAHHLRQEWWKALSKLADELGEMTLISLTATPPYDVLGTEWRRYEELCGPIDEEISVPELVKTGTLCPHQDYVWVVEPADKDAVTVRSYDQRVEQLGMDLLHDERFIEEVGKHPWLTSTSLDPAVILEEVEFAFSLLIFLKASGRTLSLPLLNLLDCEERHLPSLSRRWWQVLVHHYLYGGSWLESPERESHRQELARRLHRDGLLAGKRLQLRESRRMGNQLSLTETKIDACLEIHHIEHRFRKQSLRQVILTDFIRDDELEGARVSDSRRLGAWPVFELLIRLGPRDTRARIGLLTGRTVVIHEDRLSALEAELGSEFSSLSMSELAGYPRFVRIHAPGGGSRLVSPLTALLESGEIMTLVGTRSLLGEGWDAPCVNSLILASFVGSYMLTNQMRGRAIRKDPADLEKAASIWHLIAVQPLTPSGTWDLDALKERFKTFVGLLVEKPVIENGLDRLAFSRVNLKTKILFSRFNQEMSSRLENSADLGRLWRQAIESKDDGRVSPAILSPPIRKTRWHVFANTLRYVAYCAGYAFLYGFSSSLRQTRADDTRDWLILLMIASVIGLIYSLPHLVRALVLFFRHLPIDGSIRQIAFALKDSLIDVDLVQTDPRRLSVDVKEATPGMFSVSLQGGTFYEQSVYADCLEELLGPIENPRYLISRSGIGWRSRQKDYHAVPFPLATKKERASRLHAVWQRRLGPAELIYTRSQEGRTTLLRARAQAFSTRFLKKAQRCDRWQ